MNVAVCICTRNRPEDLRKALASAAASRLAPHQIIVSDDSDEEQAAATKSVCAEFSDVTYVRGPKRGLAANRNCCLDNLLPEIEAVSFIDDDAAFTPEFLSVASETLAATGPKWIITGRERKNGEEVSPGNVSFWGHQRLLARNADDCHAIVINATLFPISLFEEVRFDEALRYGYEEADIAGQAESCGYRIQLKSDLLNDHFPSSVNRQEYSRFVEASRLYSTYKRYRWLQKKPGKSAVFALLAPAHLTLSAAKTRRPDNVRRALESVRMAYGYYQGEAKRR
ncbi:MAG: glycosyltransferase [Capsulimonas sp.]|uniref:glycosyltransferase family 2 protein n=1 Tax=Capsulimonas sp. TaxID=2494211 RepID=UPI0032656B24